MIKDPQLAYPVNQLNAKRWSPRAFENRTVESEKLKSIFEAARWSASAFNDQPWRFFVGFQGDDVYNAIYETMVEFNQKWAGKAPVLILNCYQTHLRQNGNAHPTAQYDLGQAVANYTIEAAHLGLYVHQMTGFDAAQADALFGIGEKTKAFSISALGYLGNPDSLLPDFKNMETTVRDRLPQSEIVLTDF